MAAPAGRHLRRSGELHIGVRRDVFGMKICRDAGLD